MHFMQLLYLFCLLILTTEFWTRILFIFPQSFRDLGLYFHRAVRLLLVIYCALSNNMAIINVYTPLNINNNHLQ